MGRLVIRYFDRNYALCTGEPPKGMAPKPDELYVGEVVAWYRSWDDALKAKIIIERVYLPGADA